MTEALSIPVLPCASLPESLAFYRALGFEVTHEQTRPNVYAATRRGDVHLHFMGVKGLDPSKAYSTCLVILPEVQELHGTYAAALRRAYGKLPLRGAPRITRMRPGQSRFTVVDVDGNSVIYIRRDAPDDYDEGDGPEPTSHLSRALRAAARLRDFRTDDAAAAKVLEAALRRPDAGTPFERARVLAVRAEIAAAQGDHARANAARADIAALPLSADERSAIDRELAGIELECPGS